MGKGGERRRLARRGRTEAAAAQGVSNDETPPPTNRRSQKQKSTKAKSPKRANAAAVAPTAHTRADNTSSASPSSAAGVRQQPPQFSVAKLWSDTVGVGANTNGGGVGNPFSLGRVIPASAQDAGGPGVALFGGRRSRDAAGGALVVAACLMNAADPAALRGLLRLEEPAAEREDAGPREDPGKGTYVKIKFKIKSKIKSKIK